MADVECEALRESTSWFDIPSSIFINRVVRQKYGGSRP